MDKSTQQSEVTAGTPSPERLGSAWFLAGWKRANRIIRSVSLPSERLLYRLSLAKRRAAQNNVKKSVVTLKRK